MGQDCPTCGDSGISGNGGFCNCTMGEQAKETAATPRNKLENPSFLIIDTRDSHATQAGGRIGFAWFAQWEQGKSPPSEFHSDTNYPGGRRRERWGVEANYGTNQIEVRFLGDPKEPACLFSDDQAGSQ